VLSFSLLLGDCDAAGGGQPKGARRAFRLPQQTGVNQDVNVIVRDTSSTINRHANLTQ
jgi:hypothetical protein